MGHRPCPGTEGAGCSSVHMWAASLSGREWASVRVPAPVTTESEGLFGQAIHLHRPPSLFKLVSCGLAAHQDIQFRGLV